MAATPFRPALDLMSQYAEYHRDKRNIATHFVGIPLIVFAIGILLARVSICGFTLAWIAWALSTAWYLTRGNLVLGVATSVVNAVLICARASVRRHCCSCPGCRGASAPSRSAGSSSSSATTTKGRKPAFVDDVVGLLVGPMFVVGEWLFALGWGHDMLAEIERRAGPTHLRDLRRTGHTMTLAAPGPVLVMGAGAVGCWIGGCLACRRRAGHVRRAAAGARRAARTRPDADRSRRRRAQRRQPAGSICRTQRHPPACRRLVLLCVKSGATAAAAAAELGACCPRGTLVVSMQNGIVQRGPCAGAGAAADRAGRHGAVQRGRDRAWAATTAPPAACWRRRITGAAARGSRLFDAAGVPLTLHADLAPLQWGKLLLNLNNPVNALSGLPLRAQLLAARLPCLHGRVDRRGAGLR